MLRNLLDDPVMSANPNAFHRIAHPIPRKLIAAYDEQRDAIPDSDLDNEQPITLTVHLTIGDIRLARQVVRT
jgi:hypothetical protein